MDQKQEKSSTSAGSEEVGQALDLIKQFCFTRDFSVAVAESVSAGLLQSYFSSEEEAGLFFEGGLTTYSCRQKARHFGIPEEICEPCNGVSPEVSQRMALNICKLFDCKIGLSLTGYASPIPEKDIYDLFAYGAIVMDGELIYCQMIKSNQQEFSAIREDYAKQLIINCAELLKSHLKPMP